MDERWTRERERMKGTTWERRSNDKDDGYREIEENVDGRRAGRRVTHGRG